jgi:tetratricopeptide (TPR) repeat protein
MNIKKNKTKTKKGHQSKPSRKANPRSIRARGLWMSSQKEHNFGNSDQALADISEAIQLQPNNPNYVAYKVSILDEMNRHNEAIVLIDSNPSLRDKYLCLLHWKASLLQKLYLNNEAELCFEKITDKTPEDADVWFHRGQNLVIAGRELEAKFCLNRAQRLKPANNLYTRAMAFCMFQLGRFEDAIGLYIKLASIRKPDKFDLANLAFSLHKIGRPDEGLSACERALRIDNTFVPALKIKASILREMGETSKALACFERGAYLEPRNPEIRFAMAQTQDSLSLESYAVESYEIFLKIKTEDYTKEAEFAKNRLSTLRGRGDYLEY